MEFKVDWNRFQTRALIRKTQNIFLAIGFFVLPHYGFAAVKEMRGEPVEIYYEGASEDQVWMTSCNKIGQKLVTGAGPWGFGFFASNKCQPKGTAVGAGAPWVMKVTETASETKLEIFNRPLENPGELRSEGVVTLPFNKKNIEFLSDDTLGTLIAASFGDQLPALAFMGRVKPEILVPQVPGAAAPQKLILVKLSYDTNAKGFTSKNTGFGESALVNNFVKFTFKAMGNVGASELHWVLSALGRKNRTKEFNDLILAAHLKLTGGKVEAEQKWYVELRAGVSAVKDPAILGATKYAGFQFGYTPSLMNRWLFDVRMIPKASSGSDNITSQEISIFYEPRFSATDNISFLIPLGLGTWNVTANFKESANLEAISDFTTGNQMGFGLGVKMIYQMGPKFRLRTGLETKTTMSYLSTPEGKAGAQRMTLGIDALMNAHESLQSASTRWRIEPMAFWLASRVQLKSNDLATDEYEGGLSLATFLVYHVGLGVVINQLP